MSWEAYLVFLAAVAVFFATPPDTSQLLIISNSIRHGLRKSVYTIAGDLTANCLQMVGAAFGLAAIIATSASAFVWIKWLGVAYLVWIGLSLILSKDTASEVAAGASGSGFRLFRQGFVTSMANPFAVVFFWSAFPAVYRSGFADFTADFDIRVDLYRRGWCDFGAVGVAWHAYSRGDENPVVRTFEQDLRRSDGGGCGTTCRARPGTTALVCRPKLGHGFVHSGNRSEKPPYRHVGESFFDHMVQKSQKRIPVTVYV